MAEETSKVVCAFTYFIVLGLTFLVALIYFEMNAGNSNKTTAKITSQMVDMTKTETTTNEHTTIAAMAAMAAMTETSTTTMTTFMTTTTMTTTTPPTTTTAKKQ